MVPNGWEVKPLSNITKWSSGGTPSKNNPDYWNGEIPWISAASMRGHYFENSELKISDLAVSNGAKMAPKNSLLLLVRGSMLWNKIPVGIAARKVSFNQDVKCLVPHADELTTEFLLYWFLTYEHRLMNMVTGTGIGAGKLDTTDLQGLDVFLPPLPEQRKIAQILSTWDRCIATTEKLIDISKQQKKALMQQLLTGKKRLVDPETGKAFEGEWEEVKLGDLGKTFTGLTGKTKEHFGRGSKYIPYINIFRNSSVDMNALELVDVRPSEKQNLVKYGDIFFTTSSETPEEVGMSSVILEEVDESVYLNSFCFGFRSHNFNRVKPEFIRYLLRSEKVRRSISLLAQGATRYNLSKTQLLKITLNIPSLGEQQKIASVLTTADKDIELLEAKLAYFKQEKKALMQQLLTGKRRVMVAETEAA
ncbi:restriction endonuclease subunit S [Vibrio diabolicus]|uniref:restriction endonuclease subunit S n=1 Tax=Vibrio diabolicus TaxID=50719 RepID=UPI0024941D6D|nr:restriction endonuclease subunit S [Vibrio diabolicus]